MRPGNEAIASYWAELTVVTAVALSLIPRPETAVALSLIPRPETAVALSLIPRPHGRE